MTTPKIVSACRFAPVLLLAGCLLLPAGRAATAANLVPIAIGTASETEVYHALGRGICRQLNAQPEAFGVDCEAESSPGSVYNIEALRSSDFQLAIVQSDWQYHAYHGSFLFRPKGPFRDLRAVMSLHTEAFTIVAKAYGGVQELTDIPGRRVNIGNPGSGQRATMELLMRVMGWTAGDFRAVFELPANRQATAFCEGHFDVMVHVVGHPSETVRDAVRGCKGRVVNVRGAKINRLVDELPYYTRVRIPAGTYYGNVHDIQTFGSYATLVTTKFVPADTVHKVVKGIVANLEKLKTMHPAAVSIGRAGLFKNGLTAPLHDGVERYLQELGRW